MVLSEEMLLFRNSNKAISSTSLYIMVSFAAGYTLKSQEVKINTKMEIKITYNTFFKTTPPCRG